jgi:Fur family transcriptional regulator, ferric uptake regulator
MMRRILNVAMTHADELKSSGLKATGPRLKILEVFQRSTLRHMTAEDVYKLLLAEDADIGLATVYRVLLQFEQAGLLSRSHFESGKSVFELNEGQHHDHLVCITCGRVEEFYDAEIETRQRAVAEQRGFALQDHALALYATCTKKDCAYKPKYSRSGQRRAAPKRRPEPPLGGMVAQRPRGRQFSVGPSIAC